jgi:hypothetical protein
MRVTINPQGISRQLGVSAFGAYRARPGLLRLEPVAIDPKRPGSPAARIVRPVRHASLSGFDRAVW